VSQNYSAFCDREGHLRPEVREEIIRRTEAAFVSAGEESYDGAMKKLAAILQLGERYLKELGTKEQFRSALDKLELSRGQELLMLAGSKYLPQFVRWSISRLHDEAADTLPALPRGRPGLDARTKKEVRDFITLKIRAGYNTEQAKASAARHFNITEATIQRIWDDRGNEYAGEPDFRAVLKAFASDV